MIKSNISIRVLAEMQLNYNNQYPKKVPDMELVMDIIMTDIVNEVYKS